MRFADQAVCIGPPESGKSYLNIAAVIAAAEITDAEAIHPGYGFLAENAEFADTCRASNITFIGPTGEQIRQMGDKAVAATSPPINDTAKPWKMGSNRMTPPPTMKLPARLLPQWATLSASRKPTRRSSQTSP